MDKNWDIIVVGAGHAGCEAAHSAAKLGMKTLLLTMSLDSIAQMSCNPAIGGIAKGHLVKEIDALGGLMGEVADATGIQFRRLNTKKGSAVQAVRCQSDMLQYKNYMRRLLQTIPLLSIQQREVQSILWQGNKVAGVKTKFGEDIFCRGLILTTGTFLNGLIHIGKQQFAAGRAWEFPSTGLSEHLSQIGLKIGRLKTGTTPRINRNTIDFSKLEEQPGDQPLPYFSFWKKPNFLPQISCHITYTNQTTHEIIQDNLSLSAMYGGSIETVGPRYCPSIEDKVVKFADKQRHQIFLEPTGLDSIEVYPNGVSTSMPYEVQERFIRSIVGLENAEIMRPGYAIEYDFLFPHQLKSSLETKDFTNLFCAGQINGTTGYEEAAAQGIMAGINLALQLKGQEPITLLRNEAYIGVLIDDLVSKSTTEPYRMFTSRAEYRLLLREDNADKRLSPIGKKIGLLEDQKFQQFNEKMSRLTTLLHNFKTTVLYNKPSAELAPMEYSLPNNHLTIYKLLKQPYFTYKDAEKALTPEQKEIFASYEDTEKHIIESDIKYEGYIKRQESQIHNYLKIGSVKIPINCPYHEIPGLSNEVQEKLTLYRPQNLEQASNISGITPAAITILYIYLQPKNKSHKQTKKPTQHKTIES